MHSFVLRDIIGRGSFGCVYRAHLPGDGREYAVKICSVDGKARAAQRYLLNEIVFLSAHTCAYILKFKCAYVCDSQIHLVTEFVDEDLARRIQRHREARKPFSENTIWDVLLQLCLAVSYIHNLDLIHRDIKPSNILLAKSGVVKICDFGVRMSQGDYCE